MLRIISRINTIFFRRHPLFLFSESLSKQIQSLTSTSNNLDFAIKLTRLQDQLSRSELIAILTKFNVLQVKSQAKLEDHILKNICTIIQQSIQSIHKDLPLSLTEFQSFAQFLYFIRCNNIHESEYSKILTLFQSHFIKLFHSRAIECKPTSQSIELFCQSYVGLCSQLVGINYKMYNQICGSILKAIKEGKKVEICRININVFLQVLRLQSKKLQYSANECQLHQKILQILEQRKKQLDQLQFIKLYQSIFFRKLVYTKFYQKVRKQLEFFFRSIQENKVNYTVLEYFVSNFPTHEYENFWKFYVKAINNYIKKFHIEQFNGLYSVINLLKLVAAASKSRDMRRILTKDSKNKIKLIVKNILEDKLITTQNQSQYLEWFTNLINYQIIDHSILEQLLPLILECPSFSNNLSVAYQLATANVYHPSFLPLIAKVALLHFHIFFSQEIPIEKTQFFQAAYLCAVYNQNMHVLSQKNPKFTKTYESGIAQILRKISLIKETAKRMSSIQTLLYSLNGTKNTGLKRNFHKYYKNLYYDSLINSVESKNILSFMQLAVEISEAQQIERICDKLKSSKLLNAKTIIKLIWHLYSQEREGYIFLNTIIIINENLSCFSHPDLQQDMLSQLILYLSDLRVIKSVEGFQSTYFSIVLTLAQTSYINSFCNKKIDSLLQYLLLIQPNTLLDSFPYVNFISQLYERVSKITSWKIKKLILNNVLELNIKNSQPNALKKQFSNLNNYIQQLIRIKLANENEQNHKIPEELARQYPLLALTSKSITQKELKVLQYDILNKISGLRYRFLFSCLFKFQLRPFSDAYHLLFLNKIVQSLNQTMKKLQDKQLTLGLQKLLDISKTKQMGNGEKILTQNETEGLKIRFIQEMQKLLMRICNIEQRKIEQNIMKVNFVLQQHLLDLCFEHGVVNLSYCKQLLNCSIKNKWEPQKYSNIFKRISKLCVIRNSQYVKKIELNASGSLDISLYEMLALSSSSFYVRKILESIKEIDPLALRYIQRQSPMNIIIAQSKQLANTTEIKICSNHSQFQRLQSTISKQILNTSAKSNILTFNEGIKLIEVSFNSNTKNIYGIIAGSQSKISTTLMHSLQKIISKVCFSKVQNVYLCLQNSVEKVFSDEREMKLGQFENLCRSQNKYIYLD